LDVRTELSTYSPTLSRVEVPAQPGLPAIHPTKKSTAKKHLIKFVLSIISPHDNNIKNFAEMMGVMPSLTLQRYNGINVYPTSSAASKV
jgi:hypothetical protein